MKSHSGLSQDSISHVTKFVRFILQPGSKYQTLSTHVPKYANNLLSRSKSLSDLVYFVSTTFLSPRNSEWPYLPFLLLSVYFIYDPLWKLVSYYRKEIEKQETRRLWMIRFLHFFFFCKILNSPSISHKMKNWFVFFQLVMLSM